MSDGRISWTWRHAIIKSDLKATTKHILLTLSCFMNDMGKGCYPTTKQLAEAASLSERATCEHLDIARQHGWINVKRHGFGGRKYRNHEYEASWPSASDSLTEDQQDEAQLTDPHAQLTDSDDSDSLTEGQSNVPSKASEKDTSRKPKRISYPDDFQSFWKGYPTDKLMSKAEALKAWNKLANDDKLLATASLTGFRRYCDDHPSYRTIHAERYLKQRRFDGFAPETDRARFGSDQEGLARVYRLDSPLAVSGCLNPLQRTSRHPDR